MRYVDANVFIRLITRDEPAMTRSAATLFRRIELGEEEVAALEATVAEVCYVLGSRALYGLPPGEIRDRLHFLLSYRGVQMEDKARCLRALDLYATYSRLSFADALIAAAVEETPEREIYSYDRGFDGVAGVVRVEP